MRNTNRGFTLFELLVVIIGIPAMGAAGYFMYLIFKLLLKYSA